MSEQKRLMRSMDDRVVAGVCGGLGEYLNLDANLVRVIFVLLAFAGSTGILLYIILWIIMPEPEGTASTAPTSGPAADKPIVEPEPAAPAATPVQPAPAEKEQLTKIEGIGPKAQSILYAAGITTYKQIAEMSPEAITSTLKGGGFGAPFDATSWPKQAELAASGNWSGLQEMQDNLKGGRA